MRDKAARFPEYDHACVEKQGGAEVLNVPVEEKGQQTEHQSARQNRRH